MFFGTPGAHPSDMADVGVQYDALFLSATKSRLTSSWVPVFVHIRTKLSALTFFDCSLHKHTSSALRYFLTTKFKVS